MNDCHCHECGAQITVAHAQGYGGFCSWSCAEKHEVTFSTHYEAKCRKCDDWGYVQVAADREAVCPDCNAGLDCKHCHEKVVKGRCKCDEYDRRMEAARGN